MTEHVCSVEGCKTITDIERRIRIVLEDLPTQVTVYLCAGHKKLFDSTITGISLKRIYGQTENH